MAQTHDIIYKAEYIKDVLYFAVTKPGREFKNTSETYFFSIDNELIYENYFSDFGPLNLSCIYKYCTRLNEILKCLLNKQIIVHYTSVDPQKKTNAAFLLGCFGVIFLSLQPKDALRPLMVQGQTYRPFQDATQGPSIYTISLLDCLQAIKKARDLNFFNFQDFDCNEYDYLGRIQGGDLSWIVPGKFIAFIGPVQFSLSLYHPPEKYIDYFLKHNVGLVIRLNKRLYDNNAFRNKGIAHCDLFFPDGSCPPRHVIFKFLQISEEINCAIAVHCKAGLGRTGSLIGSYLIKHYRMTALEAIGWMRICRPGSVIGHQQDWLIQLEPWLIKQGNLYRKRLYQNPDKLPLHKFGVHSIAERNSNQRPVVMSNRIPSPPPLAPRQGKVDSTVFVRPQASKVREREGCVSVSTTSDMSKTERSRVLTSAVNEKLPKNKPPDRLSNLRPLAKGYENPVYRGIIGEGEPRNVKVSNSSNRIRPPLKTSANTTNTTGTKTPSGFHPMPPFHVLHSPLISNVNEARTFLLRPSIINDPKRDLEASMKVTQPHTRQSMDSKYWQPITNSIENTAVNRERRRLGRSPSPSPVRGMSPDSRYINVKNTETQVAPLQQSYGLPEKHHICNKYYDPGAVKNRGSYEKNKGRFSSSFGAASLDARRTAPKPLISTSTHSDEQQMATQGDMLNSIKLRRKFKEMDSLQQGSRMTVQTHSKEPCLTSQCVQSGTSRSSITRHQQHISGLIHQADAAGNNVKSVATMKMRRRN